jgi:hypothetical protein
MKSWDVIKREYNKDTDNDCPLRLIDKAFLIEEVPTISNRDFFCSQCSGGSPPRRIEPTTFAVRLF